MRNTKFVISTLMLTGLGLTMSGYSAPTYYYGPSVGVYYAGGWPSGSDRDRWRR